MEVATNTGRSVRRSAGRRVVDRDDDLPVVWRPAKSMRARTPSSNVYQAPAHGRLSARSHRLPGALRNSRRMSSRFTLALTHLGRPPHHAWRGACSGRSAWPPLWGSPRSACCSCLSERSWRPTSVGSQQGIRDLHLTSAVRTAGAVTTVLDRPGNGFSRLTSSFAFSAASLVRSVRSWLLSPPRNCSSRLSSAPSGTSQEPTPHGFQRRADAADPMRAG